MDYIINFPHILVSDIYKEGMAIAIGRDRIDGQELAIQQIRTFYIMNGIIPINDGFFDEIEGHPSNRKIH